MVASDAAADSRPGDDAAHSPAPLSPATRAAVAAGCGVAIAILVYLGAWRQLANTYPFQREYHFTWQQLESIDGAIQKYIEQHGRPPESLSEVAPEQQLADSWQNPLIYTVNGNQYELLALGRDGRPGGDGIDADIRAGEPRQPQMPSLQQFTFDMESFGIRLTSIIAGVCTTDACWRLMRRSAHSPWLLQLAACGVTLVFAWFVAMFADALHVPSGH